MATSLDLTTVISLIWGIVSVFIGKFVPAKDGWAVVISYLSPLVVCAAAVFFINGTGHWSWQTFAIDVAAAYAANQALFQAGKTLVPVAVK